MKEMIYSFLNEVKAVLKEYLRETEAAFKKRLQRLLVAGLIVYVLAALAVLLIGTAALFIVIGSLKYLSMFMPVWEAWMIMGLISATIAAMLFVVLFMFINKQLKSPPAKQEGGSG
jgi:hypothetical protein